MSDSTLRERLRYQIQADKVMWDRQGNLKKLPSSFENMGSSSPAQPPSKKSRAHKNIGTLSKAGADPQPVRTTTAPGPSPKSDPQSFSLAQAVEEGPSGPMPPDEERASR